MSWAHHRRDVTTSHSTELSNICVIFKSYTSFWEYCFAYKYSILHLNDTFWTHWYSRTPTFKASEKKKVSRISSTDVHFQPSKIKFCHDRHLLTIVDEEDPWYKFSPMTLKASSISTLEWWAYTFFKVNPQANYNVVKCGYFALIKGHW